MNSFRNVWRRDSTKVSLRTKRATSSSRSHKARGEGESATTTPSKTLSYSRNCQRMAKKKNSCQVLTKKPRSLLLLTDSLLRLSIRSISNTPSYWAKKKARKKSHRSDKTVSALLRRSPRSEVGTNRLQTVSILRPTDPTTMTT